MFRSLHVAATGMAAQQTRLEGISHNIANSGTVGFKRQRVEFQDLLYQMVRQPGATTGETTQAPLGVQLGSGVRIAGTVNIHEQGTFLTTSNPLDLAIEGNGFFAIQREDGSLAYTRAGNFQADASGRIVTSDGLPLDPPISIPAEALSVSIAANGTVTVTMPGESDPVEIGQITTASFVNPAGLRNIGHNLYERTVASGEPEFSTPTTGVHGAIMQGALEQSNVDMVEEMVNLISAQRSYEINSRVVSSADEMLRKASEMA
ncbi:MAG: flagellar basal-body rod protein FlgG [Sorangiineae bacterium NIC37A_2]|nr:MAG: flagellar basal-body rod protein FlgG [Sorangiineae bacterium NIC37A_2]